MIGKSGGVGNCCIGVKGLEMDSDLVCDCCPGCWLLLCPFARAVGLGVAVSIFAAREQQDDGAAT